MHEFWKLLRTDAERWKVLGGEPLTVQQVSDALGVDRSTVYYWEREGGKQPNDDILGDVLKLYRATDVERLKFLGLKSPPRAEPDSSNAQPESGDLPPEFGDEPTRAAS